MDRTCLFRTDFEITKKFIGWTHSVYERLIPCFQSMQEQNRRQQSDQNKGSYGGYDQLGGDDSPLAEAILDRIKHDAYKINIVPTDPANYRSMREVYGLDPALSE